MTPKSKILTLPPAMVEAFATAEPRWAKRAHAFCDPPGRPLGSAGGAVHALVSAWRAETRGGKPFESWLASGPLRQIIHAGGESRRLPAYATIGKAFIPIPVFRWSWGGRLDQTLLDLQAPLLDAIAARAPASSRLMIASGDVAILSPPPDHVPDADVIITGLWTTPEAASHFGVLFCDRNHPSRLVTFLQKPSPSRISKLSEQHLFLVDAGIWLFSARAVDRLMSASGWNPRRQSFRAGGAARHDLYYEFALGLGAQPDQPRRALSDLTVAVLPLPHGEFHHFGSSRDIIQSVLRLQNRVLDQTRMFHGAAHPHPSQFVQNSTLDRPLAQSKASTLWVENSHIPDTWRLSSRHVITGIPPNAWSVELPPGTCLDWVPIAAPGARRRAARDPAAALAARGALRFYGFEDSFRGSVRDPQTLWLGRPAADWFERRGVSPQDAAPKGSARADFDIQQARLFPVQPFADLDSSYIAWLTAESPVTDARWTKKWKNSRRVSAAELLIHSDPSALSRARAARRARVLPALAVNWRRSIFYRMDLAHVADTIRKSGLPMPPPLRLEPDDPPLVRARDEMLRAALDRPASRARHEKAAFRVLRDEIVRGIRSRPALPNNTLLDDQIIWARSPVRLDMAGGWTDTPPYCIEHGGRVLNVAVELNGQPPIQVFIRRSAERRIVVRSIDLGISETLSTYQDIADYARLGSGFAIARAALALAGFHPDFADHAPSSLDAQLRAVGGGLELSLLCAVPKGSGLGTSSILAATVLGALADFGGLNWDRAELMDRTLALEQMLGSGGGWQDQAGGVYPGVKLVETDPGFDQCPRVRWLPADFLSAPENAGRMMLYYTGLTRVARGVLGEIVRGLFLNRGNVIETVGEIGENALAGYEAFQRQDMDAVAEVVRNSWALNQQLDSGTNTPMVQAILNRCGDDLASAKLLGAGGGGYLFMIARDAAAAVRLRARLNARPPNALARFVGFSVSHTGLQITRS
ncbi:MAG: bifunctional fucokinase/L-fucose-1-P-guanylyltransferase [Kiritimatiellae bacterium]|nr:bifunctional fucokinase/L-fucose-1-P-guanylyltransferase [Kiritimatiellia bacterium]